MSEFETRVLPTISKLAHRYFRRDEAKAQDAIGYCWYRYQLSPAPDVHPLTIAWMAIKAVLRGRRMPGERTKAWVDALDRPFWNGAGMEHVRDKSPGPDRQAEMKEEWNLLIGRLNRQERRILRMAEQEMRTKDMAAILGVSAARVSQIRRAIVERTE